MAGSGEITRRTLLKGTAIATAVGIAPGTAVAADAASTLHGSRVLTTNLRVNGTARAVIHEARVTLLDLLREQLELSGTKKGCNEGACGGCTVLLDGRRVNACMVLAASCEAREVITIEGLAAGDGTLSAVQQAFIDQDAFQCGYCTPGQVVSAVACIAEGHARSDAEIAEWMSGNICRCAAYPQIVAAVKQAAALVARKE